MDSAVQNINELLEKFNSRKKFYQAESEGFGPCCILLLSQVRIYDEVINRITPLTDELSPNNALNAIIAGLKEKIDLCNRSDTYEADKVMIKTYGEIIKELEGIL